MIEGYDIICFSNDWDGDPLSKKHIISRLARNNRVLWVNSTGNRNPTASARDLRRVWKKLREFLRGLRHVTPTISVFTPLVIPFHGNPAARWVNRRFLAWTLRRASRKLGFEKPVTWTFVPSSAEVVGTLGERLVIYHCVDEFSRFAGADKAGILEMEQVLLKKADLVIVSSSQLYETKRPYNANTFLVTHGVDIEHFRSACAASAPTPAECSNLQGPVIGFFGLIADWVDLEVIRYLAAARPHWSFLMIGDIQTDASALRGLLNVRLLGRRSYQSLPAYCGTFDVAVLPFVVNDLTTAANPLKLREYLAAGLPVVATPIPEVLKFAGLVRTARTPAEFLFQIESLLRERKGGPDPAISRSMDCESWDAKVERLSEIVAGLDRDARTLGQPVTAAYMSS